MLLVKRRYHYFLVDGDYRTFASSELTRALRKPPNIYNPNFMDTGTFITIAEAPTQADFPILYPELFI